MDSDPGRYSSASLNHDVGHQREPRDAVVTDQCVVVGCRDFHGHDPGGLDFYTDFLACRSGAGNDPRPFRYHDDCQPVYRALHAAGGYVSFRRMRRGQDAHVASDSRSHSLFPGSLGCLDAGHFQCAF